MSSSIDPQKEREAIINDLRNPHSFGQRGGRDNVLFDRVGGGVPRAHGSSATTMEWRELVGQSGDNAKEKIKASHPDLTVHVVPKGSMVTMDYRVDRVRIFVDEEGKVSSIPRIG